MIGHTRTKTGLKILANLDPGPVSDRAAAGPRGGPRVTAQRPTDQNGNYTIRWHVNLKEEAIVG